MNKQEIMDYISLSDTKPNLRDERGHFGTGSCRSESKPPTSRFSWMSRRMLPLLNSCFRYTKGDSVKSSFTEIVCFCRENTSAGLVNVFSEVVKILIMFEAVLRSVV